MKARIKNANLDVEIEGTNEAEILEQFQNEHPEEIHNAVMIFWDRR